MIRGNNANKKQEAKRFNEKRREENVERVRVAQDKIDNPEKYKRNRKRRKVSAFGTMAAALSCMGSTAAVHSRTSKPKKLKHRFDSPPILISTWEELAEVKAEVPGFWLNITPEDGNGWIVPDGCKSEEEDHEFRGDYLSTHTFYGSQYKYSTEQLQEHGFNIEIANWDK